MKKYFFILPLALAACKKPVPLEMEPQATEAHVEALTGVAVTDRAIEYTAPKPLKGVFNHYTLNVSGKLCKEEVVALVFKNNPRIDYIKTHFPLIGEKEIKITLVEGEDFTSAELKELGSSVNCNVDYVQKNAH